MKVNFFDIRLLRSTGTFILLEGSILGIVAVFCNDYIVEHKILFIVLFIIAFIIYHAIQYFYYRNLKRLSLKIKNSTF